MPPVTATTIAPHSHTFVEFLLQPGGIAWIALVGIIVLTLIGVGLWCCKKKCKRSAEVMNEAWFFFFFFLSFSLVICHCNMLSTSFTHLIVVAYETYTVCVICRFFDAHTTQTHLLFLFPLNYLTILRDCCLSSAASSAQSEGSTYGQRMHQAHRSWHVPAAPLL